MTIIDYFSYTGAVRLKNIIEGYYQRRGMFPDVKIVQQAGKFDEPIFVVRSNITFDERGYPQVRKDI